MGDQSLECQIMLMRHNIAEGYRVWAIGLTWLSIRYNVRSFLTPQGTIRFRKK